MKKRLIFICLALLLLLPSVFAAASYQSTDGYNFQVLGYDEYGDVAGWPLTRADRDYTSEDYTVLNHVVYQRSDSLGLKGNRYYIVVDYFDTDEAQANATKIRIKSEINGVPVKQIAVFYCDPNKRTPVMNAEDLLPQIQSVSIPDGVEVISDYALSYFASLKTLRLPQSLRILGLGACCGMDALEKITLPKQVTCIGDYAFAQCSKLKKVTVQSTALQTIGAHAFDHCVSLRSLVLPASVTVVGDHALLGCTSLAKLDIQTKAISALCGDNDPLGYDLPKTCKVLVKTKAMKHRLLQDGCKATVKIQVKVSAPKNLKASEKNGKLLLKWSKVAKADGYRVYQYDARTQSYKKVKTLYGADTRSLLVKNLNSSYAVRAFRKIDGDVSWSAFRQTAK